MTFIEGEIIIARPAAQVFDFAADQRNEPRYNPRMARAEKVFVDRVRIRITSSDPSRPLFAGIAATGDVERYLGDVSYTTVGAGGGHDVTDHPGTGAPAAPATALHWAVKTQGTGTLSLTWDGQRGHWMVVVMNQDASSALTVRAEAGMSAPALAWLAGELLALGLLTGVVAGAMIVVSVGLASGWEPGATPP